MGRVWQSEPSGGAFRFHVFCLFVCSPLRSALARILGTVLTPSNEFNRWGKLLGKLLSGSQSGPWALRALGPGGSLAWAPQVEGRRCGTRRLAARGRLSSLLLQTETYPQEVNLYTRTRCSGVCPFDAAATCTAVQQSVLSCLLYQIPRYDSVLLLIRYS